MAREVTTRKPIEFRFNERKATAAAAYLILQSGGCISRLRLIKLLYLADRESLQRYNRPIIGDSYVSLPYGPVQSNILNLARDLESGDGTWRRQIQKKETLAVLFDQSPPDLKDLSQADRGILDEVLGRFREHDEWELVDYTHTLMEWEDPSGSSRTIPVERILRALTKTLDEIEQIADDAEEAEARAVAGLG